MLILNRMVTISSKSEPRNLCKSKLKIPSPCNYRVINQYRRLTIKGNVAMGIYICMCDLKLELIASLSLFFSFTRSLSILVVSRTFPACFPYVLVDFLVFSPALRARRYTPASGVVGGAQATKVALCTTDV